MGSFLNLFELINNLFNDDNFSNFCGSNRNLFEETFSISSSVKNIILSGKNFKLFFEISNSYKC